jgi:acetyl esterase
LAAAAPVPDALDPELVVPARRYVRVDHADASAVRREAARRIRLTRVAGLWPAEAAGVAHADHTLHEDVTGGSAHPLPLRIYTPTGPALPDAAVVYLHGGAFLSGDLDFEHPRCLELCRETGAVVVAVDYRLAPEHPFPAGFEDCLRAVLWLIRGGPGPLPSPTRLALVGASAGGALAAAVCLWLREHYLPQPSLLALLYPVLDDRLRTRSMREHSATPVWDGPNCHHMWHHYLGPEAQREPVSCYAAPARAEDLSGLAPAHVMTAGLDPLCDEGNIFAGRLLAAGVPTALHEYPGAFHGFDTLADAAVSRRARDELHRAVRAALALDGPAAPHPRTQADRSTQPPQPPPEQKG